MNDSTNYQDVPDSALQQAISRRLGKLRTFPVDTTRIDRALRAQLPPPPARPHRWLAQLGAAAASLLVIATIMFFTLQGRSVQASPNLMAQMHQDIVSGKIPTMKANSIEQANQAIAAMVGNSVRLPESPSALTMACCMRNIGHKQVACVLLNSGGIPVTMSVAKASDVKPPKGPITTYHGVSYHVETAGAIHMVMLERDGNWLCLVSEASPETLMNLAEQLQH